MRASIAATMHTFGTVAYVKYKGLLAKTTLGPHYGVMGLQRGLMLVCPPPPRGSLIQ